MPNLFVRMRMEASSLQNCKFNPGAPHQEYVSPPPKHKKNSAAGRQEQPAANQKSNPSPTIRMS